MLSFLPQHQSVRSLRSAHVWAPLSGPPPAAAATCSQRPPPLGAITFDGTLLRSRLVLLPVEEGGLRSSVLGFACGRRGCRGPSDSCCARMRGPSFSVIVAGASENAQRGTGREAAMPRGVLDGLTEGLAAGPGASASAEGVDVRPHAASALASAITRARWSPSPPVGGLVYRARRLGSMRRGIVMIAPLHLVSVAAVPDTPVVDGRSGLHPAAAAGCLEASALTSAGSPVHGESGMRWTTASLQQLPRSP